MTHKKQSNTPRRHFVATWTRSQVYSINAANFDSACEKALADRHLYTTHTTEKLTIRETLPKQEDT
jgi:hypothetical protein